MKIKIIKGTNQIGGCITEITEKDTKIIIDFGEDLEDSKEINEIEGLTIGKSIYTAVFITHSHGDHIGLIDKINEDIPVYIEEKTLELYNLTCDFCGKERVKRKINTFKFSKNFKEKNIIFDNGNIKVTAYITDHSSYNSCMYLIENDTKRILHTGDFRIHGRKSLIFRKVIKTISKIDLLITEGTALTRSKEKFITEKQLEKNILDIMKKYDQVFIMQSSTNVDRTVSFLKASLKSNKKFVLDLFSYYINEAINLNINVDFKKIFVWKPYNYQNKPTWFKNKYLNIETSSYIFPYFSMEVKESMLADIKMLYNKGVLKKTCLIYSMWNGYIKREDKLKTFVEELNKMGIDFIELHTSGHADIEAMKYLNDSVNPDYTIIIHTKEGKMGTSIFNNVINIKDEEEFIL